MEGVVVPDPVRPRPGGRARTGRRGSRASVHPLRDRSTEQVVAWEPPHHLGYTILSGFPVRHYRADVTLASENDGALVSWSATFDPKIPGTGRVMRAVLRRMLRGFAVGVAGYAERADRPGASP